jgi:acetolactate synthase I/II/III large subunit
MERMTGGQAAVKSLKEEGVEFVFGVPGVQVMHIFDALYDEPEIRLVTVRHEQSAIYMADGYARVKGKPGVGVVVPGPGVQNASAALGTAYASSSPVLLLAGQVVTKDLGRDRGVLHEINDQLDIVRPVTKWCRRVMTAQEIPGAIHEAFRQMRTGRPRPVEVEIPWDVLGTSGEIGLFAGVEELNPRPDPEGIRRAAELLLSSEKPLLWAGGGVILSDASQEFTELCEILNAAAGTTPEGKGAISEDHPFSLGCAYYGFGAVRQAAPRADVLLAVGTRLTGLMYAGTAPKEPQRLIHVDADPAVIGKNYPAEVALVGDAKDTLKALLDVLRREQTPQAGRERWKPSELAGMHEGHRDWLKREASLQFDIIRTLREGLGDDAILVAGVTNVGYWCNLAYPVRRPRTFITSSYFATLGYAFPTALGAKIAAPDRPVVCVVGDGGFLYACGELATAVRYGINLITVVFTDNAFGSTKRDQEINFRNRVWGTDLNNPDFAGLAELFGARGMKAEPHQLGKALSEALALRQPVVIEVPVPTMTAPFQIPSGT